MPLLPRIDMGADVTDLLIPNRTTLMTVPVSRLVNSPANDDPRLIEPAPLQPVQGGVF